MLDKFKSFERLTAHGSQSTVLITWRPLRLCAKKIFLRAPFDFAQGMLRDLCGECLKREEQLWLKR